MHTTLLKNLELTLAPAKMAETWIASIGLMDNSNMFQCSGHPWQLCKLYGWGLAEEIGLLFVLGASLIYCPLLLLVFSEHCSYQCKTDIMPSFYSASEYIVNASNILPPYLHLQLFVTVVKISSVIFKS